MKLNCLVVDDEPVARKGIAEYVSEVEFLHLAGQCENALRAATYLNEQAIDLVFLDIQMPKLSGIDFIKSLRSPPMIVFTTAHAEYAVESYSLDVIDYLLKPIPFERFLKASQRALEVYSMKKNAGTQTSEIRSDHFFVKCDSKFEKVLYNDVLYIEAMQNYAVIHTQDRKLITYITMSGLENQLPSDRFIKVHKSFIISIAHIKALEGNEIIVANVRIPVSRNLKDHVLAQVLGNKLFKR